MFKINLQNRFITSFGIGMKHTFNINQTNLILQSGYKYDFYKYKMTVSAFALFEFHKGIKQGNGPNIPALVCNGSCSKYLYIWHFGLSVGKYF
jgi:hypothetical protein